MGAQYYLHALVHVLGIVTAIPLSILLSRHDIIERLGLIRDLQRCMASAGFFYALIQVLVILRDWEVIPEQPWLDTLIDWVWLVLFTVLFVSL